MVARHGLRAFALVCVLLVVLVSCDGGGSSRQPKKLGQGDATPAETSTPSEMAPRPEPVEPVPVEPVPCRSEPLRSWTVHDIATRNLIPYATLADVVVGRSGTATVAWDGRVGDGGVVRTMDDPAAPGDPQSPAGPIDPQRQSLFHAFGRQSVLGLDAAGAQTLLWLSDERGPSAGPGPFTEYYNVVLGNRPPGGEWSSSPSIFGASGWVGHAQLAVNASGAAVVAWQQFEGPRSYVYAAYRRGRRRQVDSEERVVPDATSFSEVGIDDAGRVLLLYGSGERAGVKAIRRSTAGKWGKPQHVAGGTMAVGAGGAAVVAYSRPSVPDSPDTLDDLDNLDNPDQPDKPDQPDQPSWRAAVHDLDVAGRHLGCPGSTAGW